jgi:hypothetical protein
MRVGKLRGGREFAVLAADREAVLDRDFSPDGNTLALASRERGVQLFRAVPFEKVSAQPND